MKTRLWMVLLPVIGLTVATSMGQNPVITSFQGNGQLAWTNEINSNALYHVEWAADAGGPWYRTFDNIGSLDGLSATGFTVAVPMFYRVVVTTNQPPVGMVWIDGGDTERGETGIATPVHTNFISGFWMDAMEITKAKWDEVAAWGATNGYTDLPAGGGKTNNHPVHTVNWYDCVKWSNARSEKEGLTPAYYIDPIFFNTYKTGNINISNDWVNWNSSGYRLPTEAEWEKAARGSRQQKFFPWGGNTIQHTRANYIANTNTYTYDTSLTTSYHPAYLAGGFPYTSPVGSFPANGYKLYDMAGNVAEWCWDWDANYSSSYQTDPRGPVVGPFGDFRIARGGSWNQDALRARCARRDSHPPGSSADARGFRCVKGP